MLLRYRDEQLRRLAVDADFQPNAWHADLIRSYRRRHQSLEAACGREDLQALRCLDMRPEHGRGSTYASIQLAEGKRLLLDFIAERSDEVTVVGIVESDTKEAAP